MALCGRENGSDGRRYREVGFPRRDLGGEVRPQGTPCDEKRMSEEGKTEGSGKVGSRMSLSARNFRGVRDYSTRLQTDDARGLCNEERERLV